ncbi:hypothetical protein QYF36_022185 [Acer negundo]|nr:hypothetical protein QYF36_022185 [Acer negundo]
MIINTISLYSFALWFQVSYPEPTLERALLLIGGLLLVVIAMIPLFGIRPSMYSYGYFDLFINLSDIIQYVATKFFGKIVDFKERAIDQSIARRAANANAPGGAANANANAPGPAATAPGGAAPPGPVADEDADLAIDIV